MKIMGMIDFVLEQNHKLKNEKNGHQVSRKNEYIFNVSSYARLLRQPLKIWMFVPCDQYGRYMKEPVYDPDSIYYDEEYIAQYKQAVKKVLIEGFYSIGKKEVRHYSGDKISFIADTIVFTIELGHKIRIQSIEDLIALELEFTESAKKQITIMNKKGVTNQDVKMKSRHLGEFIIPKGTKVSHKTATGIDKNYHFVDDWSWVETNYPDIACSLAWEIEHYGFNVPKEFVDYES